MKCTCSEGRASGRSKRKWLPMRWSRRSEAAAITSAVATAMAASAAPASAAALAAAPAASAGCAQRCKGQGGGRSLPVEQLPPSFFLLSSGAKGADTDVDGQVRGPGEVGGHEHDGHQRVSNHEGASLNLVPQYDLHGPVSFYSKASTLEEEASLEINLALIY